MTSEPIQGIDFERLDFRDALDLAVLVEEEAKDRYAELSDQMHLHRSFDVAKFFDFMHDVESKHEAELRFRRKKSFGDASGRVTRAMLFDVEAPDYDEVRAHMTVREALDVALRAERKSFAFFARAAQTMTDVKAKKLFEELRDEEKEHERLVRIQIDKLPPEAGPARGDAGDEPVAL